MSTRQRTVCIQFLCLCDETLCLVFDHLAPAKIEKVPKSQTVRVGNVVSFKCEISGNPIPSGTWYHGKTQLKDEGRVLVETAEDFSEVEIENVEKSDEGEYSCVVKNDFGEDKCTVTLTVEGNEGACFKIQILPTDFSLLSIEACRRICVKMMTDNDCFVFRWRSRK